MNIYEMYHLKQCKFGFYVMRYTWQTVVAKIISIEGVKEGNKIKGKPPYFGNPIVTAHYYKIDSPIVDFPRLYTISNYCNKNTFIEEKELPSPGTFVYELL